MEARLLGLYKDEDEERRRRRSTRRTGQDYVIIELDNQY